MVTTLSPRKSSRREDLLLGNGIRKPRGLGERLAGKLLPQLVLPDDGPDVHPRFVGVPQDFHHPAPGRLPCGGRLDHFDSDHLPVLGAPGLPASDENPRGITAVVSLDAAPARVAMEDSHHPPAGGLQDRHDDPFVPAPPVPPDDPRLDPVAVEDGFEVPRMDIKIFFSGVGNDEAEAVGMPLHASLHRFIVLREGVVGPAHPDKPSLRDEIPHQPLECHPVPLVDLEAAEHLPQAGGREVGASHRLQKTLP